MNPDIDRSRARAGRIRGVFTAGADFVNEILGNACRNHRKSGGDKAPCDLLERREADPCAFHARIDDNVADGDENDESDRVNVVDEVVRGAVEFHGCSLGYQVIGHLVVREPVYGIPEEDGAGFETSTDFIDPDIIKGHPDRLVWPKFAWFHRLPEVV